MLLSTTSLLERILEDYNDQNDYSPESSLRVQAQPFRKIQSITTTDLHMIKANMQWIAKHIR
jgi:hypothetical protein